MKKIFLSFSAILFLCFSLSAQQYISRSRDKGFLIVSAGPSFPIGDYGSSDIDNNEDAAMATTGYNINLQLGHYCMGNFGFAATGFYTRHPVDNSFFSGSGEADHWQYYGATVGVLSSIPVASNTRLDVNVSTGVANVNSPKVQFQDEVLLTEDWSAAVPLKLALNVRFQLPKKIQLLAGAGYLYMDPKFKTRVEGVRYDFRQKISVLDLYAGIGISF